MRCTLRADLGTMVVAGTLTGAPDQAPENVLGEVLDPEPVVGATLVGPGVNVSWPSGTTVNDSLSVIPGGEYELALRVRGFVGASSGLSRRCEVRAGLGDVLANRDTCAVTATADTLVVQGIAPGSAVTAASRQLPADLGLDGPARSVITIEGPGVSRSWVEGERIAQAFAVEEGATYILSIDVEVGYAYAEAPADDRGLGDPDPILDELTKVDSYETDQSSVPIASVPEPFEAGGLYVSKVTKCKTARGSVTGRNALGWDLWTYSMSVPWCWVEAEKADGTWTSWVSSSGPKTVNGFVKMAFWEYHGEFAKSTHKTDAVHTYYSQGHFSACFAWCFQHVYPTIYFKLWAWGQEDIEFSDGDPI